MERVQYFVLPLLHYVFLLWNVHLSQRVADAGIFLLGLHDVAFSQGALRVAKDVLHVDTKIMANHLLSGRFSLPCLQFVVAVMEASLKMVGMAVY